MQTHHFSETFKEHNKSCVARTEMVHDKLHGLTLQIFKSLAKIVSRREQDKGNDFRQTLVNSAINSTSRIIAVKCL